MFAIFKREVKTYFLSPIAYVLIGLFILLSSILFIPNLSYQIADFNGNLSTMAFLLLFVVPILTMKILAEDRKNGTEVLLITSPVSLTGIVIGKYLAALSVFIVMTVITFIYPVVLVIFGSSITAQLIGGYIGFIFLGASLISVGVFASSLTENQIIASIISFVTLLTMSIMEPISRSVGGTTAKILSWLSVNSRCNDFNAGILDLSQIVYYMSFITVFLFLTVRVIEKRRWSQG